MNILPTQLFVNGDTWTALGGLALAGLALPVAFATFRKKPLHRGWTAVCLAGVATGIAGTFLTAPYPNDVLVRSGEVVLLLSPFEGAEVKGTLSAGERVRATKSHGEFAYLKSPDASGWVRKDAVQRYVGNW